MSSFVAHGLVGSVIGRGLASPVGLLPSAGHLDPTNFHFWRNLLIERGMVLPILAAMRMRGAGRYGALSIAASFLGWSLSLDR